MDTRFWSKSTLYNQVDALRKSLGLDSFPIKSKDLAKQFAKNPIIEEIPFPSNKICGILYKGEKTTSFALNAHRSPQMQNFDCMHELIHYFFHDIACCQRICCDERESGGRIEQDTYIEWQANEGAAQFLVPYQTFIPDYVQTSREHARDDFPSVVTAEKLAEKYFVSSSVIENRIDSLNYEIYCYMHGTPISKIPLKSKRNLRKMKWNLTHQKRYCRYCLSYVFEAQQYCHICGKHLRDGSFMSRTMYTDRGAGYMIFKGVELNENGRAKKCPLCKNEDHLKDAIFCMICSKPIINQCTFAIAEDYDEYPSQCEHKEPLPGNARYCPYCGNETTFLRSNLLQKWDFPQALPWDNDDDAGELPF